MQDQKEKTLHIKLKHLFKLSCNKQKHHTIKFQQKSY